MFGMQVAEVPRHPSAAAFTWIADGPHANGRENASASAGRAAPHQAGASTGGTCQIRESGAAGQKRMAPSAETSAAQPLGTVVPEGSFEAVA